MRAGTRGRVGATHLETGPRTAATACGRETKRLTRDVTQVTCQNCRSSPWFDTALVEVQRRKGRR